MQEAFGVTDHIVDVCNRFAEAGWTAVAPHLFHRQGDPVLAYDDLEHALPLAHGLDGTQMDEDVDAAIARAKGFLLVASSPLTRSSYHAGDDFARLRSARAARLAQTAPATD